MKVFSDAELIEPVLFRQVENGVKNDINVLESIT